MSSTSVLSEPSLQILKIRGSNPVLVNGFRAVSNTSYLSEDSIDSQATVLIPDQLESVETLQFLEFDKSTAETLWDQFVEYKTEEPERANLFYFARNYILSIRGNCISEEDDWDELYQRMGLTHNFRVRVLDPAFKDMQLSASAKEWAVEMITLRYEFLNQLDHFIQAPAGNLHRKVSYFDLSDKKIKPGPKIPARHSSRTSTGASSSGASVATQTIDIPLQLDGHKMFFKGGALHRLKSIIFWSEKCKHLVSWVRCKKAPQLLQPCQ
ncbi:hypothetical protein F5884DRAFT_857346 [Xylogone sp. PMI_703]|nr:hypothetical protein F5884DRAFT_857346 [Xylogone sp. PMI_703]